MKDQTDQQLLRDYAENQSETAFAEIVQRHVGLVYSAALRMVNDPDSAEDVTQAVFVVLARNARELNDHPVLSGWLHCTARNLATKAIRTDLRRRTREREAIAMNELLAADSNTDWAHVAPHLDAALGEMSEPDRDVVMLRYFERKSAREIASVLGVSDEAAQKRVNRAVERLRGILEQHGVTAGTSGLAVVLSANAVQATPIGLAITISTVAALTGTTIANPAIATTAIAMTTLQKTLITATVVAAVGTGLYEARQASIMRALQQQHTNLTEQLQGERDSAAAKLVALAKDNERLKRNTDELARLRAQGGAMQRIEQENARLKSEGDRLAKQPAQAEQNQEAAEYYRRMGPGSQERMKHAMLWGTALRMYSLQHQGLFPASFQDAVPFLNEGLSAEDKTKTALTADQYEILYHGRYEDMTNPPPEGSIVIRGKQSWQTLQGTWARVYIWGSGLGTIQVEPDGHFEKWESSRIQKTSGQ